VYRRALGQPGEVQRKLLQMMIVRDADTTFGRAHHFREINGYDNFIRRVPLGTYEAFQPWIDRIRSGESRVLTSEMVTHLIPTSGTTAGRKLIPFTAGLQRQFDRAVGPWMSDLVRQRPRVLAGPAYWSITPAVANAERETSVVPIGFADDASYLGGLKSWLVRAVMAVPKEVGSGGDLENFQYQTLLHLLRRRDLRLISVWHPSFLTLLLDALPGHWERLISELFRESKPRARELATAGPQDAEAIWPHLQGISCWGDGQAEVALAALRRRFSRVPIQPKGLLATEAVVTLPFAGSHPLAIRSHFFEFIDEAGQVHLADQLQLGGTYEVVVTTAGGLWRYRLQDCVRVTGFIEKTPTLIFLGRSGGVSDLFGEKLSEAFVAECVNEVLRGSVRPSSFAMLAPDQAGGGWGYTLFLEGQAPEGAVGLLDRALRRNPHYAYCRDLGQLQPVRLFLIADRAYETFVSLLNREGSRIGDIKPAVLSRITVWSSTFSGGYNLQGR
jgi:hypothetical protein